MGNRCPGCNKFAPLSLNESPEVDLDLNGTCVTANIRLVLESECCNEEMKAGDLGPQEEIDVSQFAGHIDPETGHSIEVGEDEDEHELEIEEGGVDVEEYTEKRRTLYKVHVHYDIKCSCQKPGDEALYSGTLEDEIEKGSMEDCT